MRTIVFLMLFSVFACKTKEQTDAEKREKARQESQDMVNKISAPLIANDVGDMNMLISTAENTSLSRAERQTAYSELRKRYCGYLCLVEVGIDSLQYSDEFKNAVQKQKDLITAKWKAEAAKQVYKEALQHKLDLKEKVNQ